MHVFVDDSGDPGFKFSKGSSTHFVIACVVFDDNLDIEDVALRIKRYRRSLNWNDNREFKFNKTNKQIRLGFLNAVKGCSFRIRAIMIDKTLIYSPELKRNKNKFYNYAIKEVLSNSGGTISKAKLRLDGHEDRAYKKAAKTYFRQQLTMGSSIIKDVKYVDSKSDNLIQLADMVAGSIYKTAQTTKTDCNEYLEVISDRVEDIWNFR